MKNKYSLKLQDKDGKFYSFEIEAEDYVQAVREVMNRAFHEMPDNSFRVAEIEGPFI